MISTINLIEICISIFWMNWKHVFIGISGLFIIVCLWIISFIIAHFQSNGYVWDLRLFWELLYFTNLLQWKLVILGCGDVHLNMIWTYIFFFLIFLFCFTNSNFKKYMDQANTHLSGNLQFQFSLWATYLWNTLYSIMYYQK